MVLLQPVVPLLTETVSEDTIVAKSTLGVRLLPVSGVGLSARVTAEESSLSWDLVVVLLGLSSLSEVVGLGSVLAEWVGALLGSVLAEWVGLRSVLAEWVSVLGLGVLAESVLAEWVGSVLALLLLCPQARAGVPAAHASGVGGALTLVGLSGDLTAEISHAVIGSVTVDVQSAAGALGVATEWVLTSREVAGLPVEVARVAAIPACVLVVVLASRGVGITLVTAVDVGVSTKASLTEGVYLPLVGLLSILSILAAVGRSLLLPTLKLRQ